MISITTIIIHIQAVRTSLFLFTFNPWQHEERGINHKSLCWTYYTEPPHTVHFVVSKILTHLCRLRPKLICFDQIRKTHLHASMVKPQLSVFSKSSNSQDHLFQIRHQPPTQFTLMTVQLHFLSGGLLWQMMIVISFPYRCKSAPSDYDTWTKRHWVVQSLTKLNNRI